jgi:hypothetical protein
VDTLATRLKLTLAAAQTGTDMPILTEDQEEFVMFLNFSVTENKENQRLLRNFDMDDFAVYFINYRTEESDAAAAEHI